jgi:uncharacterized protein (DUF1778 family)
MPAIASAGRDVSGAVLGQPATQSSIADPTGSTPNPRLASRTAERLTVNVTGRASRALDLAAGLSGTTRTDAVNRALQIYAYIEQITSRGGSVYVREAAGSELVLLKIF